MECNDLVIAHGVLRRNMANFQFHVFESLTPLAQFCIQRLYKTFKIMDAGNIIKEGGGGTSFEGHPHEFSEKCQQRLFRRAYGGGE